MKACIFRTKKADYLFVLNESGELVLTGFKISKKNASKKFDELLENPKQTYFGFKNDPKLKSEALGDGLKNLLQILVRKYQPAALKATTITQPVAQVQPSSQKKAEVKKPGKKQAEPQNEQVAKFQERKVKTDKLQQKSGMTVVHVANKGGEQKKREIKKVDNTFGALQVFQDLKAAMETKKTGTQG